MAAAACSLQQKAPKLRRTDDLYFADKQDLEVRNVISSIAVPVMLEVNNMRSSAVMIVAPSPPPLTARDTAGPTKENLNIFLRIHHNFLSFQVLSDSEAVSCTYGEMDQASLRSVLQAALTRK